MRNIMVFSIAMLLITAGCQITLTDHTPSEFGSKHQFKLHVKPNSGGVIDRDVYVTVDDVEYRMQHASGNYWTFNSYRTDDSCKERHNYWFRAYYRWIFSADSGTLADQKTINVSEYGKLLWFVPGMPIHTGNGVIGFTSQGNVKAIIIHNLKESLVTVTSVSLDTSKPQSPNFSLLNAPVGATNLFCGKHLRFQVRWDTDDLSATPDVGGIRVLTSEGQFLIELQGTTGS